MGRRVAQAQSRIDRIELMDRPACRPDLPIVVIDRVGIEEPVADGYMVALAARTRVIKGPPEAERGDRPLDETCDASALPEVVGIRDEDALARELVDDLEAVAAQAYVEMLKAGFSCVGEFQYLHHQPDGSAYDDPAEMSLRCISAADEAGIAGVVAMEPFANAGDSVRHYVQRALPLVFWSAFHPYQRYYRHRRPFLPEQHRQL